MYIGGKLSAKCSQGVKCSQSCMLHPLHFPDLKVQYKGFTCTCGSFLVVVLSFRRHITWPLKAWRAWFKLIRNSLTGSQYPDVSLPENPQHKRPAKVHTDYDVHSTSWVYQGKISSPHGYNPISLKFQALNLDLIWGYNPIWDSMHVFLNFWVLMFEIWRQLGVFITQDRKVRRT